ncbi:MAG: Rieske 2Fe-2S domain-containing protein [Gemmatimonadetes bacterium]|nr:Rieske 2Fe-2S domain-containing protein [Gemmatimonadota bacterium]
MLAVAQNEMITQTGPGTPMGEVFRRYWQPVALSAEIAKPGGKPLQVRVLSEDLVLFRDDYGRPGLLGLRCSHRLTSLAYGRVEDGGIRCAFHGWLYDIDGRCLQQPGEPEESSFKDKIRHPSYPCRELGGLVFAYMGPPGTQPPLPPFECLVRGDGSRNTDYYPINSNYLQNVEGALDPIHSTYLHMARWSEVKHQVLAQPQLEVSLQETEYGVWRRSWRDPALIRPGSIPYSATVYSYGHFFMPDGFMAIRRMSLRAFGHVPSGGQDKVAVQKTQSWYVPIDDEHCRRYLASFVNHSVTGGAPIDYSKPKEAYVAPGPENDYGRDYDGVDTISGIPFGGAKLRTGDGSAGGLLFQDTMVNETQGPIADRSLEHLGVGDRLLIMVRKQLQRAVDDVSNGRDPQFSRPEPDDEGLVRVCGNDEMEST